MPVHKIIPTVNFHLILVGDPVLHLLVLRGSLTLALRHSVLRELLIVIPCEMFRYRLVSLRMRMHGKVLLTVFRATVLIRQISRHQLMVALIL